MYAKRAKIKKRERAQSLVLVVFSVFGIFALLALTMDGGFALMRRRAAQNAADAGALAGARDLCQNGDPVNAKWMAERYATLYNDAQLANAVVAGGFVTVDAVAQFSPFFAGVFGVGQLEVSARAVAGCFSPGFGDSVLPTAWSCKPPTSGATPSPGYNFADCVVEAISPLELQTRRGDSATTIAEFHATWYPELYVIMDSPSTEDDVFCLPEGIINCDLDGDGNDDLLSDGDRSWLDLTGGGGGSSDLVEWITEGLDGEIAIHTWLPGQQGVSTNVFMAAETRIGDIALVPVFDAFCNTDPFVQTNCLLNAHSGTYSDQDTIIYAGGTYTKYFHIIGFAAFYISCVSTGGGASECPGKILAVDNGALPANAKTIEGYFITKGFMQGIGGQPSDGVDTGIYTVYLVE
ncbi:MAG: pilus assembly protein TadG-related protein [Anaerolineae bacterium]|nr:pilus assembly protein TadG-related protein [Anaerolineae bacterium]